MSFVGKLVKSIFGGGSTPTTKLAPTPLPTPAQLPDVNSASIFAESRSRALAGAAGTILTGPGGLTERASTSKKTLTGQ